MPNLSVLVYGWAGAPVTGPGASVFHCNQGDESTALTAINTFFNAIGGWLAAGIAISPPVSGDVIDELTGRRSGSWTAGASSVSATSGSGQFANGVGTRAVWPTIGVVNGRAVTGSTFLVPLVVSAYEGAGNIQATTLTTLRNAAIALGTTANGIRVYSRPKPGHSGISFPTLTGTVPDKVSWLRSRRT